jgi:hypothetical protein
VALRSGTDQLASIVAASRQDAPADDQRRAPGLAQRHGGVLALVIGVLPVLAVPTVVGLMGDGPSLALSQIGPSVATFPGVVVACAVAAVLVCVPAFRLVARRLRVATDTRRPADGDAP